MNLPVMGEFVEADSVGDLVARSFNKWTSLEDDEADGSKMLDPFLQSLV